MVSLCSNCAESQGNIVTWEWGGSKPAPELWSDPLWKGCLLQKPSDFSHSASGHKKRGFWMTKWKLPFTVWWKCVSQCVDLHLLISQEFRKPVANKLVASNPWKYITESGKYYKSETFFFFLLENLWLNIFTQVSDISGRFFTSWATREAQEYWSG